MKTRRQADRRAVVGVQQVQQQTGVPPMHMQQVQPAFMHAMMQSQQPWIIAQQAASPLVQVMQQPSLVISILHEPMVRLHTHTHMPFIVQHRLHMPPAIIAQRFCIMVQAAGSSQVQVIFIPPWHFSTFMVQRGTMTMFGVAVGMPALIAPPAVPIAPMAAGFIIIAVVIENILVRCRGSSVRPSREEPRSRYEFRD